MNTIPLNLVSPKSLEKQLKVVEMRIDELESEITELQKIKAACLTLLGTAPQSEAPETAAVTAAIAKNKKKKLDLTGEEAEAEVELSADEPKEIADEAEGASLN